MFRLEATASSDEQPSHPTFYESFPKRYGVKMKDSAISMQISRQGK